MSDAAKNSRDYGQLFKKGWQILSDRNDWELRQRLYLQMRIRGLRRRNKPFATAADLHLKLIDEKVNQKKAFTMATVLGQPRLSTFVSCKQQPQPMTESAADFFSYEMRERTNFLRTLITVVDTMWLMGRGVMKSYIDPFDDYKIIHENVSPFYLLMADDCNNFEDAYEWIHVRQMNVATFRNDRRYCIGYRDDNGEIPDNIVNRLRGGSQNYEAMIQNLSSQRGVNFEQIQLDKEVREGYMHSPSNDTIIIWEHYKRTMGGVWVYEYVPVAMDIEIRSPHGVAYKVGGRVSPGYTSFQAEHISDEGWYAPRGVGEKIADNEIYGCKVWNAKADSLTFLTTPQYTAEMGVQNAANYRAAPGEVLPPGIKPAIFGAPPVAFDQEIAFTRRRSGRLATASVDMGVEKPNQRGHERSARRRRSQLPRPSPKSARTLRTPRSKMTSPAAIAIAGD